MRTSTMVDHSSHDTSSVIATAIVIVVDVDALPMAVTNVSIELMMLFARMITHE